MAELTPSIQNTLISKGTTTLISLSLYSLADVIKLQFIPTVAAVETAPKQYWG